MALKEFIDPSGRPDPDKTLVHPRKAAPPKPRGELEGTTFVDRYEIMEMIGAGGMGCVYKATHTFMKRMIAIKLLHPRIFTDNDTLQRFQREAEATSCLSHPNIVTVHDFGLVPRPYLVMDYLDGGSLADLLSDDAHIEVARGIHIFTQICAALMHAHESGVVHRDLKPGNIMLTTLDGQEDFVKVVDFGIAKLMPKEMSEIKHLTTSGDIFGSPLYMSPEQCQGKVLDARSDIYSLGCIMYRTLTGSQPIQGVDLLECLYNHVNAVPKRFADVCPDLDIPQRLEATVLKCISKDKGDRFQSMRELKDTLDLIKLGPLTDLRAARDIVRAASEASAIKTLPVGSSEELGRAAAAVEAEHAAAALEAGHAAAAVEFRLAGVAAESARVAASIETARAAAALECARVRFAAEAGRVASASEAARAAVVAEARCAAAAHEAGLIAFAAESARALNSSEVGPGHSATDPEFQAAGLEISLSISAKELERSALAAEQSRALAAVESQRAASVAEACFAAAANEAILAASAVEAALVALAQESKLAACAREAGLAASAAEASRAAAVAEALRAASAVEVARAVAATEAARASVASSDRAASLTDSGRIVTVTPDPRVAPDSDNSRSAIAKADSQASDPNSI